MVPLFEETKSQSVKVVTLDPFYCKIGSDSSGQKLRRFEYALSFLLIGFKRTEGLENVWFTNITQDTIKSCIGIEDSLRS